MQSALMVSSAADTAMKNFTAGWYNTVSKTLGTSSDSFLLIQGNLPIGDNSVDMFKMADAIPPKAVNYYFDASQWNSFWSNYGSLLYAQYSQPSDALKRQLGDKYFAWTKYRDAYNKAALSDPTITPLTQEKLFERWANLALDPGVAGQAINTYKQSSVNPLSLAIDAYNDKKDPAKYLDTGDTAGKLARYGGTSFYEQVQNQINSRPSATIDFDSRTADTDISETWASGGVSGAYDFFFGSGSATYHDINQKASSSSVTINGSFKHYMTIPVGPASWFAAGVYSNAFKNNNYNVWDSNKTPTWENLFGPNGTMLRQITQLFIVDGIDVTITSEASYSSSEYKSVTAAVKVGFWPFFSLGGSVSHTTKTTHHNDGSVSIHYTSKTGAPFIIGASVKTTEELFG